MTSRLETKIYSQRVRRIPGCVGDAIARDAIRVPDPRTAAAYVNRGRAYFAKAEIGKAMDDFDQAILIAIYVRRLFLSRNHLFSSRKYDLALADFERRSGSVRPAFEAYLARGLVSLDRGDTVAAFKDFNFAVKAGPKSAAEETVVRRSGVEINMRAIGRTSGRPGKRQAEGFPCAGDS